jgi:transposase
MSPTLAISEEVAVGRTAMSGRELRRVAVLGRVKAGSLSLTSAAALMAVSYRQAKRLYRRYRVGGAKALKHRSAGRRSNRATPGRRRARVLALIRQKYGGTVDERFGPTLAAEHLASEDGLTVHRETLRRWMLAAGVWQRKRKRAAHRRRRERMAHFGELLQLDGSTHGWFETRGPTACLLTLVDDATGQSLGLFSAQETIWAAVAVLRRWIEQHGLPRALYTDWKNVYVRVPTDEERVTGVAPLTQFGRMCATLGITIIPASSPQAKGRIERNHGTHQDRLVKKLRRRGIADLATGNAYLTTEYWAAHNARFARPPASSENFHLAAPRARQLDAVFRLQQSRRVSNDWVVRHHGRYFQLERQSGLAPAQSTVLVLENPAGHFEIQYRGRPMRCTEIVPAPQPAPVASHVAPIAPADAVRVKPPTPSRTHPWRKSFTEAARPIWQVADR